MRTIIHSLFGTTIAKFFPGYTNYSLSIQKHLVYVKVKIDAQKNSKKS